MAEGHLQPMPVLGRPAGDSDDDGGFWRWVFVSGAAHAAVIALLLITPFLPSKAPIVPVYTVDLVGGEKLGSGAGTGFPSAAKEKPLPPPKAAPEVKETKKTGPSAAELAEAKRKAAADLRAEQAEQKKAAAAEMTERLAKAKREKEEKQKLAEEAEAEKVREKLKQLRQQRIEEALADVEQKRKQQLALQQQQQEKELRQQQELRELQRLKQEAEQRQAQLQRLRDQQQRGTGGPPTSTVAGNNPGAAALGVGGTGGGIVKSAEFIRYQNIIKDRVKSSWTWPERRTDLKVTVNVSIQENGEITGVRLAGTSGDRSFDDSVIRAIRRASPLPPPPEDFRKEFMDVILPFNSKDLGS